MGLISTGVIGDMDVEAMQNIHENEIALNTKVT